VEIAPETERVDHISAELEFMHLLAVKEAFAEVQENLEGAEICRDAARLFLQDHLGRWYPKFCSRLREAAAGPVYVAAGQLLESFLDLEASRVAAC
jgi:TorA maturation chaperone TorD